MHKIKRATRRLFAFVMAAAFATAMTVGAPAFAGEWLEGGPSLAPATITKVLVGPVTDMPAAETFEFAFEKVSLNDNADQQALADMPEIDTQSIEIGTDNGKHVSIKTDGATTTLRNDLTIDLFKMDFEHAGVYVYKVKETGVVDGITMSQAEYLLKVYVKNDGGDLSFEIKAEKVKDDKGVDAGNVKVGVDPQTPGNPDNPDDKVDEGSPFAFVNNVTATDTAFTLTKAVAGEYGDKTKDFAFTLTITVPANATQPAAGYEAKVGNQTYAFKSGVATPFTLHDKQSLVFDALPVGTLVTYTETGVEGYTASASTVLDNQAAVAQAGQKGVDFTLDAAALGKNKNESVITNTYQDVTPTGIAITVLPFVVMIAIPVLGGIAYIAAKRRFGMRA